ncbi:ATP-dependent endonuclease [Adlercreutzia sp. ZJ154]|uniref:ATP-dependent nuclease n=1 Tax=Adlercreutzia sp. ZJ154 TaxID=2709790 RepID=UPI0013ED9E57|nr:AAA family ATPase [Adlercreutzia sp. ZJ154]
MKISELHIKGFRNFINETIHFNDKTLIIGGNDTGKTNLLYALRILFDPSLSSRNLELSSTDFNIYSCADSIEITAKLEDISEDYVNSALKGAVDDGIAYIRFSLSAESDYEFFMGHSLETLEPCNGRPYIKNLAIEYVGSNRDLSAFLKRQQNKLLAIARDQRDDEQASADDESVKRIQDDLIELNDQISNLHYINDSLSIVNEEMSALSIGNDGYTAKLVAGNTDANKLLDNLQLTYLRGDSPLVFGGDGRGNQLYFATWMSEQQLIKRREKAVIFAIEEPEAHLHPHQQRSLADYLSSAIDGQVLITTHSPQIVEKFSNGMILRLTGHDIEGSQVRGCSANVDEALAKMGYRLNAVSTEVFFSNGVLLVEGPSERLFYTAVSHVLDRNIDQSNISILSVDGVGFEPYIRTCIELGIPFALRTDNDVFKGSDGFKKRLAGVKRVADLAEKYIDDENLMTLIEKTKGDLSWEITEEMPESAKNAEKELVDEFEKHGLFLSGHKDLENDLAFGPLSEELVRFFGVGDPDEAVKVMQERKAENMHRFIGSNPALACLRDDPIVAPLRYIQNQVRGLSIEQ